MTSCSLVSGYEHFAGTWFSLPAKPCCPGVGPCLGSWPQRNTQQGTYVSDSWEGKKRQKPFWGNRSGEQETGRKIALFRTPVLTVTRRTWNCEKGEWSLKSLKGRYRIWSGTTWTRILREMELVGAWMLNVTGETWNYEKNYPFRDHIICYRREMELWEKIVIFRATVGLFFKAQVEGHVISGRSDDLVPTTSSPYSVQPSIWRHFWNAGTHLPGYTVSQPQSQQWLPWKPTNIHKCTRYCNRPQWHKPQVVSLVMPSGPCVRWLSRNATTICWWDFSLRDTGCFGDQDGKWTQGFKKIHTTTWLQRALHISVDQS